MSQLLCPMLNKQCIEKQCAWYTNDCCAIHSITDVQNRLYEINHSMGFVGMR